MSAVPESAPTYRLPPFAPGVFVLLPLTAAVCGLVRHTIPPALCSLWAIAGLVGIVCGLLYRGHYRGLGFVPYALTGAAIAGIWAVVNGWNAVTVAVASALLGGALIHLAFILNRFLFDASFVGGVQYATVTAFLVGCGIENLEPVRLFTGGPDPISVEWFAGLAAVAALLAWVLLFRPAFEFTFEPVLGILYRVRAVGPGLAQVPIRGPCLIVANHACWFDPLFLMKVVPRPLTPMMTAQFYDVPALHWLMVIFGVIRVPNQLLKQDVPEEIRNAIAALDRGECVVIFPEGYLRRSEDRPLKRFGRGVWQILQARPGTPVFPCWIEGGWGSFCSYFNGKPTKNKRPDFRRRIGVGVDEPVRLDADTLANHLRTRLALMNHVAAARVLLGLPAIPRYELPAPHEATHEAAEE